MPLFAVKSTPFDYITLTEKNVCNRSALVNTFIRHGAVQLLVTQNVSCVLGTARVSCFSFYSLRWPRPGRIMSYIVHVRFMVWTVASDVLTY